MNDLNSGSIEQFSNKVNTLSQNLDTTILEQPLALEKRRQLNAMKTNLATSFTSLQERLPRYQVILLFHFLPFYSNGNT